MKKLFTYIAIGALIIIGTYQIFNSAYNDKAVSQDEFLAASSDAATQELLDRSEAAGKIRNVGRAVLGIEIVIFAVVLIGAAKERQDVEASQRRLPTTTRPAASVGDAPGRRYIPAIQGVPSPIVDAWVGLRTGQFEQATSGFDGILLGDSENLDALYGKGMALRATGQLEAAVGIFRKVLDVSQQRLTELRAQHVGHETAIGFENPEEARYMMLGRMIRQRLAEIGVMMD